MGSPSKPEDDVDRALEAALDLGQEVLDAPTPGLRKALDVALDVYRRESDAWAASRLSARRKRPPTP